MPCLSGYGIWRIIFFPVAITPRRAQVSGLRVLIPGGRAHRLLYSIVASDLAASVS
jgi:hypothetical protein